MTNSHETNGAEIPVAPSEAETTAWTGWDKFVLVFAIFSIVFTFVALVILYNTPGLALIFAGVALAFLFAKELFSTFARQNTFEKKTREKLQDSASLASLAGFVFGVPAVMKTITDLDAEYLQALFALFQR